MTESIESKHPLQVLTDIEERGIDSEFKDMMANDFPSGLRLTATSEFSEQSISDNEKRKIHALSEAILRRAFSDGIPLPITDEQPSPTPKATKGSDLAIVQASLLEQRELNEASQQEQLTSKLTDMPNREAFVNRLDQKIASNPSEKLTVGFLDMDKLKFINDTYGHELADNVIRRIGKILSSNIRAREGGEDMLAAHRSGDEFLICIDGAEPHRIKDVANSVLKAINRLHIRRNPDGNAEIIEIDPEDTAINRSNLHQVGASMGFTGWHEGMDTSQLMMAADEAMYKAKEAGRNNIVISEQG